MGSRGLLPAHGEPCRASSSAAHDFTNCTRSRRADRRFPHVKRLVTRLLTVNGTSALPRGMGARLPAPGAGGSDAAWAAGPVSPRLASRAVSIRTRRTRRFYSGRPAAAEDTTVTQDSTGRRQPRMLWLAVAFVLAVAVAGLLARGGPAGPGPYCVAGAAAQRALAERGSGRAGGARRRRDLRARRWRQAARLAPGHGAGGGAHRSGRVRLVLLDHMAAARRVTPAPGSALGRPARPRRPVTTEVGA